MNNEPIYNLLNSINYPEDLRKLTVEQLPEVCGELRQDIIKELCCNPGHFAASLGTVELTVALHYVYNTPYDRIVWDVGHQAYGHKILTGRREAFSTNRKLEFPVCGKCFTASCKNFVAVCLMPHVPYNTVVWCIVDVVQSYG